MERTRSLFDEFLQFSSGTGTVRQPPVIRARSPTSITYHDVLSVSAPATSTASYLARDDFLANQLDVLTECSICREDFDKKDHAPTRLTGSTSCHHVFGLKCLEKWVRSGRPGANRCPMCRKILFNHGREIQDSSALEGEGSRSGLPGGEDLQHRLAPA
ncbi:hypothetical protein EJ02DRAFT_451980 [Clathrospora elynae]|uniref:RING-type domain-containing protein n=1 Tax=Clathrospora elynae TaxID=706981 RepID=A0A6A5SZQ0_9PLEO|nr:hypothetical protein EJ02DRAFT_451980 [Clathrospora elynae]